MIDFDNYKEQELKGKELHHKRWNNCLDLYLTKKTMLADDFDEMSVQQRIIINEIKKSYNRNKETQWKE